MARNDEGEFELVLGNKQVLGVFFVMVVLLGVVFTMGYVLGRNTLPVGAVDVAARRATDKPIDIDSPSPVGAAASTSPPPKAGAAPLSPGDVAVSETRPAAPPPSMPAETPAPPVPEPKKPEPKKEEPKPIEKPRPIVTKPAETKPAETKPPPKPEPVKASPAPPRVSEPGSGAYLQVSAVRRAEGEALAEILQKKGFPALLTPSPREGIFRVLVGPLKDAAQISKTKADLEAAGMKNTFLQRF